MRLVVALTGSTGATYGVAMLTALAELGVETHLVVSRWAEVTIQRETGRTVRDIASLASVVHTRDNQGAPIASGSFRHDGMIVALCSMKTLAAIRHGYADGLIARSADVSLKERRRLVLLVRETPLNEIHLENMLALTRMGAIMAPPSLHSTAIRKQLPTLWITPSVACSTCLASMRRHCGGGAACARNHRPKPSGRHRTPMAYATQTREPERERCRA